MTILRSILGWLLYGGTRKPRHYEAACLNEWKNNLPLEAARMVDRQMRRFNHAQRSPGGALVTFSDLTDKTYATWTEDLFLNRSAELTAGRVWFLGQGDCEIKGDIVLDRGRIFAIYFSKPPKCLRAGFTVVKVKMLADPMRRSNILGKPFFLSGIQGELGEMLRGLNATNLRAPLPQVERGAFVDSIDARLPDDYLELVTITEGATISNWQAYGLSEVRRIVQPTANFYLLAEAKDGRAVGVAQESQDAQLYFIDPEGGWPEVIAWPLLTYIQRDLTDRDRYDNLCQ